MEKMNSLPLIKRDSLFNINIPDIVEQKIRFLCNNIHNIEWSGILFYKIEGSFETGNLTVNCVDILQMDEGNSVYTEFSISPDICSYICENPELSESGVYQGLIHSHHSMSKEFIYSVA